MKKSIFKLFAMMVMFAVSFTANAQDATIAKKVKTQTVTSVAMQREAKAQAVAKSDVVKGFNKKYLLPTKATSINANAKGLKSTKTFAVKPLDGTKMLKAPLFATGSKEIYGSVVYSTTAQSYDELGIFEMPVAGTSTAMTQMAGGQQFCATYGGVLAGENYYSVVYYDYGFFGYTTIYVIDAETWTIKNEITGDIPMMGSDLTYDETTETIYGCFYNDNADGFVFGFVDYEAGVRIAIADLEAPYKGIAAAADGTIYAVTGDGALVTVNKETGAETVIGETGITHQYIVSAAIDQKSGDMYMTSCTDNGSALWKINTADGSATKLYDFAYGEEVTGLAIKAPLAEEDAPASVDDLAITFEGASLTGKVSFTAPATTFAEAALVAGGTYVIKANDEVIATGEFAPGQAITTEVTVPEAGNYEFVVYAQNEVGEGPKTKARMYVGEDYAAPVENVVITYDEGLNNLMDNGALSLKMTFWAAGDDWHSVAAPDVTINGNDATIVVNETSGSNQWQGQVHFMTGVAIEKGITYTFAITFNSTQALNDVTVKPVHATNDVLYFGDARHNLAANEDVVVTYTVASNFSTDNLIIALDFVNCQAGTVINVKDITITRAGEEPIQKMFVTWDATKGVNGGYIDMSKVTYNVTRTVGTETTVVATGIKATKYSEAFPEPEGLVKVSYAVAAVYNGEESWATESNAIVTGAGIIPPYAEGFDDASALDLFTVIDANEDGKTWTIVSNDGNNMARASYNSSEDMDDWLITAPIKMEAGKNYEVSFKAKAQSNTYAERVEAFIGTAATVDAMVSGVVVAEPTDLFAEWVEFKYTFVPAEDGKYYFGIHGCSDADAYYLWVDDIAVSAGAAANAPGAVGEFTVTADEAGEMKATVVVTAPNKTVAGDALTDLAKVEIKRDGAVIKEIAPATPGETYTFVDETIDVPGFHTYVAVAYNEVGSGKEVYATVFVGAYTTPYAQDFEASNALDDMTIIDANQDGKTWVLFDTEGAQGKVARMTYNSYDDMDDWLITAPIRLEKGMLYEISFKAAAFGESYPERVEAKVFAENELGDLYENGTVIVEPTDLTSGVYVTLGDSFAPQTTGKYYVAIHGCSDPDMFYLYVDDIQVSAGSSALSPAAPEVTVVADMTGALKATVNIVAPTKAQSGDAIESLDKIEVSRGGAVVATITGEVTPGQTFSVDDTVEESGVNTWEVVAYNAEGKGKVATATAFIGFDVPEVPTNIVLTETENGVVEITWKAVETDVNGKPITGVTYSVIDMNTYERVVTGINDTTISFVAVEEGQDFVQYAVGAATEIGEGDFDVTAMIPVGAPYAFPYEEGFANGELGSILALSEEGEGTWNVFTTEQFSDLDEDADGNGGFAGMQGSGLYTSRGLYTGKISLAGATVPVVEFYVLPIAENNENTLDVQVREVGEEAWTTLETIAMCDVYDDVDRWVKITIDLANYKDKVIQLQWTATTLAYTYTFIDGINVKNAYANDLLIKNVSAPAKAKFNEEFNVNVTVQNNGMSVAEGYTVKLIRRDVNEKVMEIAGETLASGKKAVYTFTDKIDAPVTTSVVYQAVVEYDVDEDLTNNDYDVVSVEPAYPTYPAVTDLDGTATDAGVQLTWSEPEMSEAAPEAVTENFEDAESFSQAVEGWTLVDADGAPIGGIESIDLGISTASWFVFDNSDDSKFNSSFEAHSGNKFMSTMYNADGSKNNDWMISPALFGGAQTISLWAKSYTTNYGKEKMEVLYSTTDKELDSFESIGITELSDEWTEVTFDVPAGAKYFAIRCVSQDIFMLFVDDVTFIPAEGASADLALVGYNVYRDYVKVNAEPVAETTYVDADAAEGTHVYTVTVVYEQGESAPSNTVTVGVGTGINTVNAVNSDSKVYTIDGRKVNSASRRGLYIIDNNGKASKVVVK